MKTAADHLLELIRIPSDSSRSNRSVIEYAQEALCNAQWNAALSIDIDSLGIEKMNLIAAPAGQNPEMPNVDLAFLCHTDTVPPAHGWTAALAPFVDAGVIYGCGACDVKGFLACLLCAATEISKDSFRLGLRVALTADEEIGCFGSQRLLQKGKLLPRTLVIGEPTSLHPARAGKGYCLGEMTVFGAEAHSAHPRQGRSAIYNAARVIQAIEEFAKQLVGPKNLFFDPAHTTINIGTISGGTAKNVVPAECRFLVEWRPVPGETADYIPAAIERICKQMTQDDAAFRSDFKILRQQRGFETAPDSNLVHTMEYLTGRDSIAISFGSEASVFASLAEEIVVFGPGDMRTAHSPRECVALAELQEAVLCIKALMQKE